MITEQRSTLLVLLTGSFANYLRIDTGGKTGKTKIYKVKIFSHFRAPMILGPSEIGQLFIAGPDAVMHMSGDHVLVTAIGNDPYISLKKGFFRPMYWQASLIAAIVTFLTGIIVLRQKRLDSDRCSSTNPETHMVPERFEALDGLRGLEAILVIADHTCGWFRGAGASGVWIFFALSGFLLARPFIGNPQAVLSFSYMSLYFKRRFMRILSMYYAYIFVAYVMSGHLSLAFVHGLFLEGNGHLWAIPPTVFLFSFQRVTSLARKLSIVKNICLLRISRRLFNSLHSVCQRTNSRHTPDSPPTTRAWYGFSQPVSCSSCS